MTRHTGLNRRQFLTSGAAGTLLVTITPLSAQPGEPVQGAASASPAFGSFLRIGTDGTITVVAPCVEMGQGAQTALAIIVADELGAEWDRVSVLPPPLGVPYRVPGRPFQNTSGSQMVRRWNTPLRKSAAAARTMLIASAAEKWGVDAGSCRAEKSAVVHAAGERRASFGDLVSAAAKLPVPESPVLRTERTFLGQLLRRLDIPAKVDGSAMFGADVRLPGMVYAAIRQSPVFGAQLLSVGLNGVDKRSGVIGIVKLADAVAVVATTFWQAKRGVDDVDPKFSITPQDAISSIEIARSQRLQLDNPVASVAFSTGKPQPATPQHSASMVSSDYAVPFLHHATMETMNCTVSITADRCEFWVPTQNLTWVGDVGAKVSGLPLDKVFVNATFLGGGFGRKFEKDYAEQAALIAKQVGRPVQLIWTREEDVQHGFYRPAMTARLSSTLTPDGDVTTMRMRIVGPSTLEHTTGFPFVRGVDPVALLGVETETPASPSKMQQYSVANLLAEYVYQPTHVPVGYWRSVGASENAFFIESHVDELAAMAGQDPYRFRRRLLRDSARAIAVLDRAAAEAGWGKPLPAGRFQGIAFTDCVGSLVCQVVELSMEGGSPKVHKVVCVIDCGVAVHPDNVIAQVSGSIVMGLSAALGEQVTIKDGRCEQSNFHDYNVARIADTPVIEVHIVDSGQALGGVGEAGVPAVAPALCNAIFAASGKRIRTLPILS